MTFICIVCRELLTHDPEAGQEVQQGAVRRGRVDIVSTKCGHLYHLTCLNNWFTKQRNPRQECPHCRSAVATREFQRIFPIGDEETDELETRINKEREFKEEAAILKNDIRQIESILEDTGTQLQEKSLALDIMQYEYDQKLEEITACRLEVRALRDQLNVVQNKNQTLESKDRENFKLQEQLHITNAKLSEAQSSLEKLHEQCLNIAVQDIRQEMNHLPVATSASVTRNSMGCQADISSCPPEVLLESLPRHRVLDLFMTFLEKEKITNLSSIPEARMVNFSGSRLMQPEAPPVPARKNNVNFSTSISTNDRSFNSADTIESGDDVHESSHISERPVPAKRNIRNPLLPG